MRLITIEIHLDRLSKIKNNKTSYLPVHCIPQLKMPLLLHQCQIVNDIRPVITII